MELSIPIVVISFVFAIIGWLLSNKDKKQAEEIDKLFQLHKEDADKLSALQIYIAGQHYERKDLDLRFDKLETSISKSFDALREDVRDMARALHENINKHHRDVQ